MPHVTVHNKKMTNINLGGGDYVMGISKNPNNDVIGGVILTGDAMEKPHTRPLRYTPRLKCDLHLESLRPEREGKHSALKVSINVTNVPVNTDTHYLSHRVEMSGRRD